MLINDFRHSSFDEIIIQGFLAKSPSNGGETFSIYAEHSTIFLKRERKIFNLMVTACKMGRKFTAE